MKKSLFFIICFLAICTFSYSQGFVSLFNGHDLAGWKINGTEKWYAQNGELIAESGPDKEY